MTHLRLGSNWRRRGWHKKKGLRAQVPSDLWTAKSVLLRSDKVQPSLEPKYTGPFRGLRRWGKCFRLQFENRADNASIDRLRPFYEDERHQSVTNSGSNSDYELSPTLPSGRPKRNTRPPNRFGWGG